MPSPLDQLTKTLGLPAGMLDALYPWSLYQTNPPIIDRTPPGMMGNSPMNQGMPQGFPGMGNMPNMGNPITSQPIPSPNPFSQMIPQMPVPPMQPPMMPPRPPFMGPQGSPMPFPPMGGGMGLPPSGLPPLGMPPMGMPSNMPNQSPQGLMPQGGQPPMPGNMNPFLLNLLLRMGQGGR